MGFSFEINSVCPQYILKKTSNAKSDLVLLECTPRLCLRFVLYDLRLVSAVTIVMYSVMNYPLLMVAFYANRMKFHCVGSFFLNSICIKFE